MKLVGTPASWDGGLDIEEAPDGSGDLLMIEGSSGRILRVDPDTGLAGPSDFFDGLPASANAATVFAFEMAPDYATSGRVYISYRNDSFEQVVEEYTRDLTDPSRLDPATRRTILTIDHQTTNPGAHFGADLAFDASGALLVSTGDSDDFAQPGVQINSQDPSDRRGKILRIDPLADAYPGDTANNYAPAAGNPDLGPGSDPAIWALGLRNPFKLHHDADTGTLFIADVGEDAFEEVNIGLPGANYGWAALEGAEEGPSGPGGLNLAGVVTDPYYAYAHDASPVPFGRAITGGIVYRGNLEALHGNYIFADLPSGQVFSLTMPSGSLTEPEVRAWMDSAGEPPLRRIADFTQTQDGRLFASQFFTGSVYEITSAVIPLPAAAFMLLAGVIGLRVVRRPRQS